MSSSSTSIYSDEEVSDLSSDNGNRKHTDTDRLLHSADDDNDKRLEEIELQVVSDQPVKLVAVSTENERKSENSIDTINNTSSNKDMPSATKVMAHIQGLDSQEKALFSVTEYIHMDGDLTFQDSDGFTMLHAAAVRGFVHVVEKLLENKADPLTENTDMKIALMLALEHKHDSVGAVIVKHMPNESVLALLRKDGDDDPKLNIVSYMDNKYGETVSALLDCLVDNTDIISDDIFDNFDILDMDETGHTPTTSKCTPASETVFQIMARRGSKVLLNHKVIRLVTELKWQAFAKRKFMIAMMFYLLSLLSMTFCVITSLSTNDVTVYNSTLHYARAVTEVMTYSYFVYRLVLEIFELNNVKAQYFTDPFNIIEMSAAILILLLLPVRYCHQEAHWYIFAVGYFLWVLKIFKYSIVYRQSGAYAHILWTILKKDLVQFSLLFVVIDLAFSGSFSLALKGDGDIYTHNETSSIWKVLFVGVRTITESEAIVEYVGSDGYSPISATIMLMFICITIVILLNILIAQMSATYSKIQEDANKRLDANRTRTVARIERQYNICCCRKQQKLHMSGLDEKVDTIAKTILNTHPTMTERVCSTINYIGRKQIVNDAEMHTMKTAITRVQTCVNVVNDEIVKQTADIRHIVKEVDFIKNNVSEVKEDIKKVHLSINNVKKETNEISKLLEVVIKDIEYIKELQKALLLSQMAGQHKMKSKLQSYRYTTAIDDSCARKEAALLDSAVAYIHNVKVGTRLYEKIEEQEEHKVLGYLNALIDDDNYVDQLENDLNGSCHDKDKFTALHMAVKKNFYYVVEKLLHHGVNTLALTSHGFTPLEIALQLDYDFIGALLVKQMDNDKVLGLFSRKCDMRPKLCLQKYCSSPHLKLTVQALLDDMIEQGPLNSSEIDYTVLETDKSGFEPTDSEFNPQHESVFQILARKGDKLLVNHKVVRLLTNRKWQGFGRSCFVLQAILYIFSLFALTYAVVTSLSADDVTAYDSDLQYSRAFFEITTYLFAVVKFVAEIIELLSHGRSYFKEKMSPIELISSILILSALPVRYLHPITHWYILAVGYFLWVIIIFKYAAVFRQTGTYAQVLWYIVIRDVIQFSVLFAVINLAFTGGFMLVLKATNQLSVHDETSTFWRTLLLGIRTVVEAESIVEYTGKDGYTTSGTLVMLLFLFVTMVILLNILIAQLSDTYTRVQGEATRNLEVNIARIISNYEKSRTFNFGFSLIFKKSIRGKYYTPSENIADLRSILRNGSSDNRESNMDEMCDIVTFVAKKQVTNQMNMLTVRRQLKNLNTNVEVVKSDVHKHEESKGKLKQSLDNTSKKIDDMKDEMKGSHKEILEGIGLIHNEIHVNVHSRLSTLATRIQEMKDGMSKQSETY